jgi:large subunit ribosomal protein L29
MSKARELHALSTPDLEERLRITQQQLLNLRFQYATRQTENYARIRLLKREIARIKTILRERELAEMNSR